MANYFDDKTRYWETESDFMLYSQIIVNRDKHSRQTNFSHDTAPSGNLPMLINHNAVRDLNKTI